MVKPNLILLKIALLSIVILAPLMTSVLLPETFIHRVEAQVPGPLPTGVTADETIFTTANLTLEPNPIGVGQPLLVNLLISPAAGPDQTLQGYIVTITKPDGNKDTINLNSYPGMGSTWFEYYPDQLGLWKLSFQFRGMYFPAGRYYNGIIIANSSSNGTFYSKSTYYTPSLVPDQIITVQSEIVPIRDFRVSPPSGPGSAIGNFSGLGFPSSTPMTISYQDPNLSSWRSLRNITTNSTGSFIFSSEIPDLHKSLNAYDQYEEFTSVSFRVEVAGSVYAYTSYEEYMRGLKKIGNYTANGLFGNNTNAAYYVKVQSGDKLTISGKWFAPGVVNVKWDGFAVVGTVTANEWRNAQIIGSTTSNSTGYFELNATVPNAAEGEHYVAIEDSQTIMIIKVNAQSTPTIPEMPNVELPAHIAPIIMAVAVLAGMLLKRTVKTREP